MIKTIPSNNNRKSAKITAHAFHRLISSPQLFFKTGIYALCVVLVACFLSLNAVCAEENNSFESITLTADEQFAFAEMYFKNGNYPRAIGEYERFIFLFPHDSRIPNAAFRIGSALLNSNQYRRAVSALTAVNDKYSDTALGVKARFLMSEAFQKLGDPSAAINVLEYQISQASNIDIADEANYRIGWIYIEQNQPEKARERFEKISAENRFRFRLSLLTSELNNDPLFKVKNPKLAGWLSVIPGAGFTYLGRYKDALAALLLNTGFIWGGIEAFRSDNEPLGALLLFIGGGFYSGNIYGAVSAAHKYNRASQQRFIKDLKSRTGVTLTSERHVPELRPAFMVQWRF